MADPDFQASVERLMTLTRALHANRGVAPPTPENLPEHELRAREALTLLMAALYHDKDTKTDG